MGAYQYVALDPGGKEHRGVLEGDTPRHVRQLLRDQQLLPVEVAEIEGRERKSQRRSLLASRYSQRPPDRLVTARRTPTEM